MPSKKHDRLKTVLEAYGADPARWPQADRCELGAVLDELGGLPAERKDAGEIDTVLAAASSPIAPEDSRSRLLEITRNRVQSSRSEPPPESMIGRFAAASTLAASLLIGVYIGSVGSLDQILPAETETGIWSDADSGDDPLGLESGDDDNAGASG